MNNWKDAIILVSYTTSKNSNGFPIESSNKTKPIPANIRSLTRREEEHSKNMEYNAEIIVEIMKCNYDNQPTLIDELTKKSYSIKRAYPISSEIIELTCSDISRKHKNGTI